MITSGTFASRLATFDLCITGMYLALLVYFGVEDDRVEALMALG
jgi:hypothetical protein